MKTVPAYWYDKKEKVPALSRALSQVYRVLNKVRTNYYRKKPQNIYYAPVPVIVVGNITVGGTGKTPVCIALLEFLRKNSFTPGLISRGYGGKTEEYPQAVTRESDPVFLGDEPVLIAMRTGVPVIVDPNRKRGIEFLLKQNPNVDCIISDDGLQHYAMGRDIEILVIDGARRFGNEMLLPAGPLREKINRRETVDFQISNGETASQNEILMQLQLEKVTTIQGDESRLLADYKGQTVHAVAGIGNPDRFFDALRNNGLDVIPHAFGDHALFSQLDFKFNDDLPVFMTEKDAVKCQNLDLPNAWVVPAQTVLPDTFYAAFLQKLQNLKRFQNG